MKKLLVAFIIILSGLVGQAQMIVTDPVFPVIGKPVTIYFHSDLATGAIKNYTLPLYAHTGVNLTNGTLWQGVVGSWGVNATQPIFEYLGFYTYKLTTTPDIHTFYSLAPTASVKQIALVIRAALGSPQTSPDIFINLFTEGLNVSFTNPIEENKTVELNASVPVTVNASLSDSILLYKNGELIAKTTSSQELTHTIAADVFGEFTVITKAFAQSTFVADTFSYFVRPAVTQASLPEGIKDGINYVSDNSVILCLYAPFKSYSFVVGEFNDWKAGSSGYMNQTPDGLRYWLQIDGLTAGKEYAYQYLVDGTLLIGDPYCDKVLDPWNDGWISSTTYPGLKAYPKGQTIGIVSVFQTAQTPYVWKHSDFTPPVKENAVIYELLVRDFIAKHDWKTLTDTLNYFSKLGVSALEIMPFNEFEGNESWGYNPSYYFAPDKYYGPKKDLKAFIDSCHSRGIAVIMDMVLNHSYGQSPLTQLYWNSALSRPAANNPWYNETSPNTAYSWGSDFNHESQETKDFVDRVTAYWMTEYGVDGYRFDFTKGFTNKAGDGSAYDASRIVILKRMADQIWAVNPDAYVILEHFADNSEETILANYGMMIWGNMNYKYNEATMGWNEAGKSDLSWVSYKSRGWNTPNLVGYMESHDEERLMYKNLVYGNSSGDYNIKDKATALKRIELAAAFFITIPGPKMIWQFEELGYDTSINYKGRIGNKPILWNYLTENPRLNPVFSSLIHLKTQEPAFSTTTYSLNTGTAVKRIDLNHADMDVRIMGNFDVVSQSANPNFSKTGNWYEYFSGETLNVTNVTDPILLEPGEYRIYSTKALVKPNIPNAIRNHTVSGNQLRLFPNPVENILYLEGKSVTNRVSVTDIQGRIIKTLNPQSETGSIDFSGMKAGIYVLILEGKDSKEVHRIVKR
jgi:1,4-alpha-glucan branching enzyme